MSDMRKEILSLEKSIVAAKDSEENCKVDLENAESKTLDVNGESPKGENPGRLKRLKSYLEKAKYHLTSLNESLEAKVALLARAVDENKVVFLHLTTIPRLFVFSIMYLISYYVQALFLSLYRNFSVVLSQRLSDEAEIMNVDSEEPVSMETDQDNDKPTEGYNSRFLH